MMERTDLTFRENEQQMKKVTREQNVRLLIERFYELFVCLIVENVSRRAGEF